MFRCVPLVLLAAAGSAQQRPLGVEAFDMPQGTPPSVSWAPQGKRFAYMEKGALWLYDVPASARRELVSVSKLEARAVQAAGTDGAFEWQNRRVQEQSYQWSAEGGEILVAAGGDLFLYHMDGGSTDQLTATADRERDPKLSPDGRYISFRREHDLYCLEVASRKVTRLTRDGSPTLLNAELDWVYPEELSLSTAHWWSPDSTRIAFLQFDVSREPVFPQVHMLQPQVQYEPELFPQPGTPNADVRLGVVSLDGTKRWMNLGEPRDHLLARVHWSPDGKALAALRLNRVQSEMDVLLADARTGASRVVLHEQDPWWINVRDDFQFLDGGRQFLWASERAGYRHLYRYTVEGERLTQITSGAWEVTALAGIDETARQVYYVSTEETPLERQLYRIDFDGGNKQRLSRTAGVHAVSMSPVCDYYLDTASSLTQPPGSTLYERGGEPAGVYSAPAKAPSWLLPAELVDFRSSDGERLYGRLIKPEGFTAGRKYPVIVMIYGGPGPMAQQVRNAWPRVQLDQFLAHRGFLIWQMDNRGSAGRGHQWEARIHRKMGAQELKDQLEGLRYLESLGIADMSRAGIHGWSYGGYMTLYALLNAPDTFRAGAAGAPVTDWRNYDSIYTERYMSLPADNPEGYRDSAPVTHAAKLKAKLLLLHNLEDDNVHFANTMQMAAALQNAGKHFEMAIYPQRTHGVTGPLRSHFWETLADFFERTLK